MCSNGPFECNVEIDMRPNYINIGNLGGMIMIGGLPRFVNIHVLGRSIFSSSAVSLYTLQAMRPLRFDNAQGTVQTGLPLDLKVNAGVCPA